MNTNRIQKAQILFQEIGNVQDNWLNEAITYRPRRVSIGTRIGLIAACLSLSLSLVAGSVLVAKLGPMWDSGTNAPMPDNEAPLSSYVLDEVLAAPTNPNSYTAVANATELDFYTGHAHVVWKSDNGATLYVSRALRDDELDLLLNAMQKPQAKLPGDTQPACPVWILCGDGRVYSPYLQPSNGNMAIAELFDYNVEVVPNAQFTSCVTNILN